MKQLEVPYLPAIWKDAPVEEVSGFLDKLGRHPIDQEPWPEYNYKAKVSFVLAHANEGLLLKFYVSEEAIRARYTKTNEPVYEDSCVEMFLAFKGEDKYYNFEFNLLGTCLSAFGSGRKNRKLLPEKVIAKIKSFTVFRRNPQEQVEFHWQLTLLIPLEVFCFHEITRLKGIEAKANFFKCGDNLPIPHFLSMNNIKAEKPDFHLPEFFSDLHFL